jgi:pimeloyl-ACP methyl ester carboxylesterase
MTTYVILSGVTAGGWFMGKVARRLRKAGHEVFTPTYTGLGERSHLLNRDIDLDTHIQDVLNVFEYEDLNDVILVGKSYSGIIIEAVAEAIPERIRHLVHLDTAIPQNGLSLGDLVGPEVMAQLEEVAQSYGDGWRLPADKSVDPRLTDHPLKTFYGKVELINPAAAALPRTYICCTEKPADALLSPALYQAAARARDKGWGYHELPTDHEPERDMPDELAAFLLEIA